MKRIYFGEYLVRLKLISYEILWEGLTYQRVHKKPLGAVCLEHGVLNHEQIIKTMNNKGTMSFGEYCIKKDYLTERQLQAMLVRQENQGLSIGRILIKQEKITKKKVDEAFSELVQYRRNMTTKKNS